MKKRETRRASDRSTHYTYLITDHVNNMRYYGVHSTDYDPSDINLYHGSSSHLNSVIEFLGIENFSKEVRKIFSTRLEADVWEGKVLRRLKVTENEKYYNKSYGGLHLSASGYVVVKYIHKEGYTKVPVDDPYIGVIYDYLRKGYMMSDSEKQHLSSLYKGKWVGDKNPVHKFKNDLSWRLNISKSNERRPLSIESLSYLKSEKHLEHIRSMGDISEEGRYHKHIASSYNSCKFNKVYFYKGVVYLHPKDVPDFKDKSSINRSPYVIKMDIPHPKVNTVVVDWVGYSSIQEASRTLEVHSNTIRNRLNNDFREGYYYIEEHVIKESRNNTDKRFLEALTDYYKELLHQQKSITYNFSSGMSDLESAEVFNKSGNFLNGTTFERIPEKDTVGTYSYYKVYCPLCSNDEYVQKGICSGEFRSSYSRLKLGYQPCRCGDPKNYNIDLYLYHIKEICSKEGIEFISLGEIKGKKDTRLKWKCPKGYIHDKGTINSFLDKGVRCRCCTKHYKNNPPNKINLTEIFKQRRENYVP